MSLPLVSILIPTYNGQRFLRETLRSALGQTHRNIEVVVGDDASTDQTATILAEAAAADPRVRVIRHERNIGAYRAPGALLEHARGEYIKYLLHDDLLAPNCVHVLLKGMRSPTVSLAFTHRSAIGEDSEPIAEHEFLRLATAPGPLDGRQLGDFMLENLKNVVGEVTTCMFRRRDVDLEWLWQVDGRRLAGLGDLSLWLRLLRQGSAYYDPRTLSSFRIHGDQQSRVARVQAGAALDWPRLIDWGRRQGFLSGEGQELRAHTRALASAATMHAPLHASPDGTLPLEAVFLSTVRLLELRQHVPTDVTRPLLERAHGATTLARLSQQLDVWSQTFPMALAAPALCAAEVDATVEAFRQAQAAGAAERFLLAVDESHLREMASLVETAIERGSDIDIEVVPTSAPAALLTSDWLAVAPRDSTWHEGRTAVWTVERSAWESPEPGTPEADAVLGHGPIEGLGDSVVAGPASTDP